MLPVAASSRSCSRIIRCSTASCCRWTISSSIRSSPTTTRSPAAPRSTRRSALRKLHPDIVLEAIDADVIKTYVELGLGVGIMADIAFNAERDRHLRAMPVGHLFGTNVTRRSRSSRARICAAMYHARRAAVAVA